MECESLTETLLDLVDGALPEAEAREAQSHIEGCEGCRRAYERVRAGSDLAAMLEVVDPPAGLLDHVLDAARTRAQERAPAPEASVAPATTARSDVGQEPEGLLASLMQWVGGFAMRP